MKIAQKLFLAVGLFLTIALIGLGSYSAMTTKNFLQQAALDNLHAEAQEIVKQVEAVVETATADLQVISAHKAFEDFLTFGDFGDTDGMSKEIDNLEAFLARVYKAKPIYSIFQLYGQGKPALQLINGTRKEKFIVFDHVNGVSLLKQSIETNGSRLIHRAVSQDDKLGIESLLALGSGKKLEGCLRVYQNVDEVLNQLLTATAERGIQLILFDNQKNLITASDGIKKFASDIMNGKKISGWVTDEAKIPGLNWSIMVGLEEEKAFNVIRSMIFGTTIAITIALLCAAFVLRLVTRWIVVKPLMRVSDSLWRIARGEAAVTTQLDITTHDEVGNLAKAFNEITMAIHRALLNIVKTSGSLSGQTIKLLEVATRVSEGASQQRDSVNSLARSMTEAAEAAGSVVEVTSKAAIAATHVKSEGHAVRTTVKNSLVIFAHLADEVSHETVVISQLARDSEGINKILQSIRGIAEQTNLLALNAAIEAARAGENGRGFAVVADEVRVLAGRTQGATVEIESMVKKILAQAQNAAKTMNTTRESAESSRRTAETTEASVQLILQGIEEITDLNTQVAAATAQQGLVAQEVNGYLASIALIATSAADGAEEMHSATDALARLSEELTQTVGQFKL